MTYADKPVGWIMLTHRCTREQAEAMLQPWSGPLRLVLPPVIDRHEVSQYEWSEICSKVESIRRADRDEKILQERLARRRGAVKAAEHWDNTQTEIERPITGEYPKQYSLLIPGRNLDTDPITTPPFNYRNAPNQDIKKK